MASVNKLWYSQPAMNNRKLQDKGKAESAVCGLVLAVAFILSRCIFYYLGGGFIAKPINFALQYLDPQLLQHDLLQSLLYLHSQPPLFNAMLGLVLKVSSDPPLAFMLFFHTAGLVAILCLYGLLRSVRVPAFAALVLCLIYLLNPTVMLYEQLLYYTYIESALILVAAFCLLEWCRCKRPCWAAGFWLVLCCLGGMRSVFHPVFFIGLSAALGLFMIMKYGLRKQAVVFCAFSLLAIAPLGLVMAKNYAVYGFFGCSSWDGMNLWTKSSGYGPEELDDLHQRGIISSLALQAELEAFRALDKYDDADKLLNTSCHHPADCDVYKSTRRANMNHAGFVPLSRQLKKDSFNIIKNDPARFAFQTLASYSLTLWHASDSVHGLFHDNMEILQPLESVYRFFYFDFLGSKSRYSDNGMWLRTALISAVYLLVYAGTLMRVFRSREKYDSAIVMVSMFCLLVHVFTLAVSSIVEFGENNRFRFPVDGIFLVLAAGTVMAYLPRFHKRNKCRSSL